MPPHYSNDFGTTVANCNWRNTDILILALFDFAPIKEDMNFTFSAQPFADGHMPIQTDGPAVTVRTSSERMNCGLP